MLNPTPLPPEMIPDTAFRYYGLPDGSGYMRYAIVKPPGKAKGTFLVVPGRRECIEKKYAEAGRELLSRGYKVIFFEPRSQGLSSRYLDGEKYQRDFLHTGDAPLDDWRAFVGDVVPRNQEGPLFVLAHSMGALTVTRWLSEDRDGDPGDIKGAILTAPAYAFSRHSDALLATGAWIAARLGKSAAYAPDFHDYDHRDFAFKGNELSQDPERFHVTRDHFTRDQRLKVGGVTWGWVGASLASTKRLKQPEYMERIETPMLVLLAAHDDVTPREKVEPLLARLQHAEIAEIPGSRHDILNEAEPFRAAAWQSIDAFLAARQG